MGVPSWSGRGCRDLGGHCTRKVWGCTPSCDWLAGALRLGVLVEEEALMRVDAGGVQPCCAAGHTGQQPAMWCLACLSDHYLHS